MTLFLALCFVSLAFCQNITTVYLVRHAEKELSGSRNPNLSDVGKKRAEQLKTMLSTAAITAIYSTDFIRTQSTVKPLAEYLNYEISPYHPFKSENMVQEVLERRKGESVLIVGHSNTVPQTIKALSGIEVPEIKESEYTHLFILTIAGEQKKLQHLQY